MEKFRVKIKYSVIKEKEFEIDTDTFDTTENIQQFWSKLGEEENSISIKGLKMTDLSNGEKVIYKYDEDED